MLCSWALVLVLSIGIQLGAGHSVDRSWELPKVGSTVRDISHICAGRQEGELVSHPLDCNGYFSCSRVPTLLYCDQGLHFDAERRFCDIPEKANCQLQSDKSSNELNWWPHKPRPVFVAVDVVSGQPVNPMEKYDPEHVECRHFGAYFLPHPTNCRLYFICAYGHLHRHQCGRGTWWNFEMSECQTGNDAVCYGDSRVSEPYTDGQVSVVDGTTPSSGAPVTVCYIVGSSGWSTLQQFITEPETSEVTEVTEPTPPTVPSPPRAETSALTCPSTMQSYISHPEDCSKYYICISGMPVLTSCPKGLFWDQKSGYCEMEKNVKCFQK